MLALIDSDSLCYANAFAVQEKDELTGEAHVIGNGEKYLRKKLRDQIATIVEETGATDYKLFLTGKGNFREEDIEDVPTLYKANRTGMVRPLLLQEAREYLVEEFNAIIVNDMEADDVGSGLFDPKYAVWHFDWYVYMYCMFVCIVCLYVLYVCIYCLYIY